MPQTKNASADDAWLPTAVCKNALWVFEFEQRLDRSTLVLCMAVVALGDGVADPVAKVAGLFGRAHAVVHPVRHVGAERVLLEGAIDLAFMAAEHCTRQMTLARRWRTRTSSTPMPGSL